MSWFGDPADGRSIIAFAGGGGSARTGVLNFIVVQDGDQFEPLKISTGDQIGVALQVFQNPVSKHLWMVVALGSEVRRYSMPLGQHQGTLSILDDTEDENAAKDLCNAVTVNGMADRIAVGCDSGLVKVYAISDDQFPAADQPLYVCQGHTKAVCAMQFSLRNGLLLSSAKDGTARVWKDDRCLSEMKCDCTEQNPPTPTRSSGGSQQILVRGCAFLDMEGQCAVTVASKRRGAAFLSQWTRQQGKGEGAYECTVRTACSPCPVSAMSLSQDGDLLALGCVDGTIILWSVPDWKPLKTFKEIHDLPVTCIAARPFPVPLQGEEETGVEVHARSASADSKLGLLTLQRKAPRRRDDGSGGGNFTLALLLHRLIQLSVLVSILWPLGRDAMAKCKGPWQARDLHALRRCVVDDVLIAPSSRAGVSSPPF